MKKVIFNEKIALKVFGILKKAYEEKIGIFSDVILPEERWAPEKKVNLSKKQLANYLLFAALPMRGGLVSEDPLKWLYHLFLEFPEIFDPKTVIKKFNPESIHERFKLTTQKILGEKTTEKAGGALSYKIEQHAEIWYRNSIALCKWWGGDLRNVFHGVTEFEEAFRMIDYKNTYRRKKEACFFGMRRKIFSLLTIWLQNRNLIPVFPTPVPIDFHALRILWSTEVLNLREWDKPFSPAKDKKKEPEQLRGKPSVRIYESLTNQIAKWSQSFLEKNQISHLAINPALWFLSRNLCAEHLQASSQNGAKEFFPSEKLLKNSHIWPRKYPNPCSFCFLQDLCKWTIPAAVHYRLGVLIRLKRVECPMPRLTGIDWTKEKFFVPRKNKNRGAE